MWGASYIVAGDGVLVLRRKRSETRLAELHTRMIGIESVWRSRLRSATEAHRSPRLQERWQVSVHARCRRFPHVRLSSSSNGVSHVTAQHKHDVLALGNICVDIVLPVAEIPPKDEKSRKRLLEELTENPPPESSWEVGGSCNFMIAAARLGLDVVAVGHFGGDIYADFLQRVLQEENISAVEHLPAHTDAITLLAHTLLCFVLVDPNGQHGFCSRHDLGPWPLLAETPLELPSGCLNLLKNCRAVFTNGFIFDELPLEVVQIAVTAASESGAALCFDPGPRCHTMREGPRKVALEVMMDLSDIVLMTEEEAKEVTGEDDPEAAARFVLQRPGARTEWCVIKMGAKGALLCSRHHQGPVRVEAIKVDVSDTVGCGDSFAAAIVLGYIHRYDLQSVMVLANAVGAATAMGRGAGRNVATAQLVQDLLYREAVRVKQEEHRDKVNSALGILQSTLEEA